MNLFKKSKPIKSGKITFILSEDYAAPRNSYPLSYQVLNALLDVPYHHLIMAIPWRWKKQYLAQAREALSLPESDDCSENTKPLWAERQSDYTGINPLQCPNCDKSLAFVGCFFGGWNPLQHLFEKAGKDASIAAALLRPG